MPPIKPTKVLRSRYVYYVCECGKKLAADRPFCKFCGREIAWEAVKNEEGKYQNR